MRGWGSSGGQRRSGHRPGVSASGARLGLGPSGVGARSDSFARGKGRVHRPDQAVPAVGLPTPVHRKRKREVWVPLGPQQ